MKSISIFILYSLSLIGCTSSYTVGTKQSGVDFNYEQFNNHMEHQKCTVILSSGVERKVTDIVASKDSVSWTILTSKSMSVPKTHVYQIQRDYTRGGKKIVITFSNGQRKEVDTISISADSVTWMEPSSVSDPVPTSQIVTITYVNHARGLGEGIWKGLLGGFGTFLAIYLPSLGNHDDEFIAGVAGSIIGLGIIVVSPITFAIIGHTEEYHFPLR